MQTLTDNALMLKVKSGDIQKLGLLYERHKKRLFGFFYNMNSDAALSEDLVQNVFMRMLKYKHTFTGEGSFAAWMFSMARNISYDYFKKNKKQNSDYQISTVEYKLDDGTNTEEAVMRKEELKTLKKAMHKMDPDKREVLVLSKFKELKFSEIGKIIGCSEGAAKVKAHRALKELRTIYLQIESA
ncbi:sigma-70 family RNA polymerase sigma factor [Croceitalea sp. MTPC9]|uniref:RNA polymerase sigma factor n=1 Tax=unclassified Croceitalea TaxID=2632280 RepID=UPI002B381D6A|nr:sigma-70 family RNA polymerase sigma factor [Croceitalea sp. MTPC6]GMN17562.1 sigma-70 family RNA polymerase sigma factor [Croceitalea sp. MTPC9]